MSKKTIIIIGVLLVLSFVAYTVFFKGDSAANPASGLVSSKPAGANAGPPVGTAILGALSSLNTLKLDTSFFNDPVFLQLKNFTRPIPSEPVGRDNPFAPIGSSGGPAAAGTSSSAR